MKNTLTWIAVLVALAGWGMYAKTSTGLHSSAGTAQSGSNGLDIDVSAYSFITQGAAKQGVRECLPRIDQVTNFISPQSQSSAVIFTSPEHPDNSITTTSIGVTTPQGLSYASAAFAPLAEGGCAASYDAIVYWDNACADVAQKAFADLKVMGALREQITQLDGGPTMRVFLMPAGKGCLSIKKEMVY